MTKAISALDALLNSDINVTEDVSIKRLGITLTFGAVNSGEFAGLVGGKQNPIEMLSELIVASEQDGIFRNVDLMQKHNANSPAETVRKTLLAGEIAALSEVIQKLSGFDLGAATDEAKN